MIKNTKLLLPLFLLLYINVHAQLWPGPHPLLSPWLKFSAEDRVSSQVDTFENKFGYYRGEGMFNIPVYRGKDWLTATGSTPLIGVTIQGAASYMQPLGDFISSDVQMLRLRLGGSFIYSKGLRNLYMLSAQAIAAHDYSEFNFKGIYPNGSFLWRHRKNDQLSWTLGATYTSVLAKNMFLPLAGIHYRPLKEDLISVMLPLYAQYTHFFNKKISVSTAIRPFGGIYTVNYPVNDSITLHDVKFNHKEIRVTVQLRIRLSYQLSIEPEAGWSGSMKLPFEEITYNASPSIMFRCMIRYKFGERANVAPILDFDPADFTNADPEVPEN